MRISLAVSVLLSPLVVFNIASAQTIQDKQSWNLPPQLTVEKVPEALLQQANGDFGQVIDIASTNLGDLTFVTERLMLNTPETLNVLIDKAVQAPTDEQAAALGLGLCMATSNLITAAGSPDAVPAQGQSARDLARYIVQNVINASQTSDRLNRAVANSFGIAVNQSGALGITCKNMAGEAVATASVQSLTASDAGVGGMNATLVSRTAARRGGVAGGAAGDPGAAGGGGLDAGPVFPTSASAMLAARAFTAGSIETATVVNVPGPEAGTGLFTAIALAGFLGRGRIGRIIAKAASQS